MWAKPDAKCMCRTTCKKTQKCVTRQQRMGYQSRISAWPDGKVLRPRKHHDRTQRRRRRRSRILGGGGGVCVCVRVKPTWGKIDVEFSGQKPKIKLRNYVNNTHHSRVKSDKTIVGCTVRECGPGPPSLLYNGYRVFPGGRKQPGHDTDPSPPSSAKVWKQSRAIPLLYLGAFMACKKGETYLQ
jgi:hypothetical protein